MLTHHQLDHLKVGPVQKRKVPEVANRFVLRGPVFMGCNVHLAHPGAASTQPNGHARMIDLHCIETELPVQRSIQMCMV